MTWVTCRFARCGGLLWTLASPRAAFAYLVAWMGLALVGLLLAERRP